MYVQGRLCCDGTGIHLCGCDLLEAQLIAYQDVVAADVQGAQKFKSTAGRVSERLRVTIFWVLRLDKRLSFL